VHGLQTYLTAFVRRTQPLVNVDAQLADAEADFTKRWEAGEIEGWGEVKSAEEGSNEGIWCPACELCQYGARSGTKQMNRSKNVLKANCVRRAFDFQEAYQGRC